MSDQFYSYLSSKIIDFFIANPLTSGDKYNIQFENENQVRALYEELKNNYLCKEYEYKDSKGEVKYKSYLLDFKGIKLIVAATIDNIQPDFLTRLRNMVGVEDGYKDKAIMFIHNTTLDSIMGGTEAFGKEGMPFHINAIQKDIEKKLIESDFSEVDQKIVALDLERKKNDLFGDNISIFEYKDLLAIVNGTCIEKEQYKNFGLFYDSELRNFTGNDLKKRLENNAIYYSRVDEIHNYGNPDVQLERYFDDKGVDKLKGQAWKDADFKEVNKAVEGKKEIKPLEYISGPKDWDKEEGASKVKSRIRNIIVFNENHDKDINLEFSFDDTIYKNCLQDDGDLEAVAAGKKIKVFLHNCDINSNFYKIVYKNDKNIKFEFKIVVVGCSEKYLESIKTKFSIVMKGKHKYISINTNDSAVIFNEYASAVNSYELVNNYDTIEILEDQKLTVKISESFEYEDDSDVALCKLKIKEWIVPIGIMGTSEKIAPIEGLKVWKLKREKKCDFKFVGDNKIQHGTKEYFTRDEFRKNLQLEKQILKNEGIYCIDSSDGLEAMQVDLNFKVRQAYIDILRYFNMSGRVPSLTYLNDELKSLYQTFIKCYIEELKCIHEGDYLTKEQKNLFKIGVIRREIEDKEIIFTSLHPLNMAYQLHINDEVNDECIADDLIKKFTSNYLLPYIMTDEDKLYIPMEQFHSPEWKYYVDESLPRYKSSRDFVAKLVNEKIEEFVGHFKYLFNMANNAPIRINLMNTGDSKEILQGIFKYYIKQLKSKNKELLPIDLFIYSNKNITNSFEEVAFNDNLNDLKETYELDLNVDIMSEDDVVNLYRDKVHFYAKKIEDGIEYAHITFIEMSNDVRTITSNMTDITSGIILNGLISGVPSVFLGDSYRTGFGTQYANTTSDLINIAIKLNALNAASRGEPYNENQCKAISVPNKSKRNLDDIYNSSHWITFIDPKVDLNFFKNDPAAKDLLIIHYSDQYTTAGGYDAITVTRKSEPYQRVIEEFLTKKGIDHAKDYSPSVINMFNAVNGDWLLRLLSSKSHFPKEKISILSAIKLALAEFKKDNIIWVPISLEEVLRVSGGAGLKQSEGFFSAKNLGFDNGVTSDDLLFVGIETVNEEVFVHYYPIEVKIGENTSAYIQKGIAQAKATKKIFNETLLPNQDGIITNTQKVYRNFLMQLVITSAEKLNLYDVCSEESWKSVIDSDLRRKLLNEEYEISNSMSQSMGEAAVISFKRNNYLHNIRVEDGVMLIELSEEDGINFITKSVEEIRSVIDGLDIEKEEVAAAIQKKVEYEVEGETETQFESNVENDTKNEEIETGHQTSNDNNEKIGLCMVADTGLNVSDHQPDVMVDPTAEYLKKRNMEILFGVNQKSNREIYWCPNDTNKLMHTNTGIIGIMGTGKTQFTKSMVTQIYKESKYNIDGRNVGILIFDYKGDYNQSKQDFLDATNAKVYKLYNLPFNPFYISFSENPLPMLPLHIASTFAETIIKAFGLGKKQEAVLGDLIIEAYERRGIEVENLETWGKPAPTLQDVYDIYEERDDIKKDDSLYAAFRKLIKYKIFEADPLKTTALFDLIDGVTVIDLANYDPGTQNLVVAITLDLFYSQMQAHGHSKIDGNLRQLNKIVLVDEADNFLSKNFSSLKKILKEGREFGVGTILSTQLLSHFSTGENAYANYILTWVIHNVADLSNKDVKYIFNTQSKSEEENLYSKIKSLNKHYSLVKMGDSDRALFMKDKAFWELVKQNN